jgi:hypothetical protein
MNLFDMYLILLINHLLKALNYLSFLLSYNLAQKNSIKANKSPIV